MGRGFIARAGVQARSSHIRKKARATAVVSKGSVLVPAWTRLQGVGPWKFSQPLELVCGIFPGHTSTCLTFQLLLFLMMGICLCHRGLIVSYLVSVESFFDLIFLQCLETSFICTTLPGFPYVTESMELSTQPLGKC